MKKLLSVLLAAGVAMLVACGPSAEEKAAAEKKIQDSIAAAQKHIDDSLASAQQAAMEKQKADSMAAASEKMKADSMAAAEAHKKKSAPAKKASSTPSKTPVVGKKKPGAK